MYTSGAAGEELRGGPCSASRSQEGRAGGMESQGAAPTWALLPAGSRPQARPKSARAHVQMRRRGDMLVQR